jgi:photosystem II stability/assembly factor-like uncharacterized protein
MDKSRRTTMLRCAAALALGAALLLPLAGSARAGAQRAARDDAFTFHGSGGQRQTVALQGGRYVIDVYAGFFAATHPNTSTCSFTAVLNGVEHPIPGGFSTLGSLLVGGFAPYRYMPTLNLQPGHYTLVVSPLTDCDWSVSIGGGGTDHPLVSFGSTGLYHRLGGYNERTTIAETTGKPYSFGFAYNAWGDGFAAPTASLTVLQHGQALHTYKLTPTAGDYGQTAFSTALAFPSGSGDPPGAYTARFTATLGGRRFTTSVDYTVQSLAPGHWTTQPGGTTNDLADIACPGPSLCVSPGIHTTIVATTDGRTWTQRRLPLASDSGINLYGATCPTVSTCFVVGDQYFILGSTDGGRTWSTQNGDDTYTSFGQNLIGVTCPTARHCYAVGSGGIIVATTDGGAHWALQSRFASGKDLTDVACPTETTCYAVGQDGTIVRTTDGGATWQRHTVKAGYLFSIACPTMRVCYATGQQGTILRTGDGGSTWTRQNNPLDGSHLWVDSVVCSTPLLCHAVGQGGTLLLTTDGGHSWRDQVSPTSTQLNVVTCPAVDACYAVGRGGTIVKGF